MIGGRADAADVSTASGLVGKMPPSGGGFLVTLHNIEDQGWLFIVKIPSMA